MASLLEFTAISHFGLFLRYYKGKTEPFPIAGRIYWLRCRQVSRYITYELKADLLFLSFYRSRKVMEKQRRFERVVCNEKVIVHYNDIFMEGRLRNISVNGALVHLNEDMLMQHGEQCLITICLNIFDITLHFLAEVRHNRKNEAGVKFIFMDSDTKIYLKSLLAFRTANPQLISEEFDYSAASSAPG